MDSDLVSWQSSSDLYGIPNDVAIPPRIALKILHCYLWMIWEDEGLECEDLRTVVI